jgi:uridine kinase
VTLAAAEQAILAARRPVPAERAALVAVSGIDGAGKGYAAARLRSRLERQGRRVALVGVDGWLNLPPVRFSESDPAGHFYRHAFRFEEMFERLVLPLRETRSIRLEADFTEETAASYRKHLYAWDDVDVILLEGIYLLRRDLRRHYDLSIWIDCTFETALERAIARGQEGLGPEDTVRAFRSIYFPAQEVHFEMDDPKAAADRLLVNDPRLESEAVTSGRTRETGTPRCRS